MKKNSSYKLDQFIRPLKIGQSEHKRSSLINSYYSFIELVIDEKKGIKNLHWEKDKKKIFDLFIEKEIYFESNKKEIKISREKSLFKSLNLWEEGKNGEIQPTKFSINLKRNYSSKNNIFGMTEVEWGFFLIVLWQRNNNCFSSFLVMENILKGKPGHYLFDEEKKNNYLQMDDYTFEENVWKLVRQKSSSPKPKYIDGKKFGTLEAKNPVIKKWLHYSIFGGDPKDILLLFYKNAALLEKKPTYFSKEVLEFLLNNDNDKKDFKKSLKEKSLDIKDILAKDRNDILERVKNRVVGATQSSYFSLNKNHLNPLPMFYLENRKLNIFDEYKEFIEKVILNKDDIIKSLQDNSFITPEEFSRIIKIKEVRVNNNNVLNIYKDKYGTIEKIIETLNLFLIKDSEDSVFRMRKRVEEYIKNSNHLNGICTEPTFYEFIISFAVLFKNNKKLFDLTNDEFIKIIRDSLNLTFGSKDMAPQRFASGGRPDAIIYDENGLIIIVEPTLQLYRQTQMEADAIADHVNHFNKEKLNHAIMVSPIIENRIKSVFNGWNNEEITNCKVLVFNQEEFIKYMKS